ncbi:hypothetical protein [Ancylobacter defluvii]|uniref:Uncharacterized protein n=1 Tax=Ancylobacter defluvii TaxID=1282440 RepID=A0A9W6JT90_9HYPH|nr:hypothetical protein [Ancylobacter defluvii]MBS7590157.1 hypothetical protein [Ancylobacter defluvii]GLK82787.1 hypothetical protein GCM10017653_08560 [Ancylobacter defluvii]
MSYDPDHYVVDSRRLGSSYLLAAIVLGVLFAQCFPETSTADHATLSAAQPAIVVLSLARFDPSDDETDFADATSRRGPSHVAPAGFGPAGFTAAECAAGHEGRTSSIQAL